MTQQTVQQVVVVGGGTAGWLTAANLAKRFNSTQPGSIQVTIVESPDIPTIGVGEGTWPTMRKTLANLGISETEFLVKCNASLKQATKFVNWRETPAAGDSNHYYHLFTSVYDASDFNLAPYWQRGDLGSSTYAQSVSVQGEVCERKLAPKAITHKEYEGAQNYAYHLDAGLFADLLKQHAVEVLGVKHIAANVSQVNLDKDEYIASVTTDRSGVIEGDFFIDCTGFKCLLLGDALGVKFKKVDNALLTDHAVVMQVPYQDEQQEIASCTISTAQEAGWIWDIGLSNRRGTGYVYSSKFTSHEQAEQTLRDYVGPESEGLMTRVIPMNIGYREKFWHKNCLAVGLSAAFIEPLEASAIFLMEAASNMLCDLFPRDRQAMAVVEKKFNQSFQFRWNKTIDFIKMHYVLSQRTEPFWLANQHQETIPETLTELLERWRYHPVSDYDFDNVYEPFPMESYQYVLYGMGFKQDLSFNAGRYSKSAQAIQNFNNVQHIAQQVESKLPSNRDLLNKVNQYGFQKL
ncbi:tryptophan 7-halogenase [Alteromonadales bacterium alter-6D02]|nr:tryptophan 7-halogenase [Alteromonadales bacterium alter-6D02]